MKTKKNLSVPIVLIIALVGLTLQACRKYPDGPLFSFRSRIERVANTWRVDSYIKNGTDYTYLMAGYTETYTKDGNYFYTWDGSSGTGVWTFQDNDSDILLTGIRNQRTYTLIILRLEEKEFWYYYIDGNDRKEFHMVQS
jgi:hypothetical protein